MLFREKLVTLWYLMMWPAGVLSVIVHKFGHIFESCKEEKAMKHMRFCIHNTSASLRTPVLSGVVLLALCIGSVLLAHRSGSCAETAEQSKRSGVTIYKPGKCFNGYTLYSSRQTEKAHLIDMKGNDVHTWEYRQGGTWHYAEMLPNGNLLAIIKDRMILELDWNSKLVWKADIPAHHDFERLHNGNTLVLCREYPVNTKIYPTKLKSDWYVELTPSNKKVWEWHFDRHVGEIMAFVPVKLPSPVQDWAHTNTVEVLPETPLSKKDERFKKGNVLFSCRNIDTIGVIDREKKKVVWAWGPGHLDRQHMPTMLPNGHILIYDNGSHRKYTRIVELDPLSKKTVWQYEADPPKSFFSPTRGSNQRLPNGNTFVAESDSGRLFEVTAEGEIVWEFLNPDRRKNGGRMALYRAIRYANQEVQKLLLPAR